MVIGKRDQDVETDAGSRRIVGGHAGYGEEDLVVAQFQLDVFPQGVFFAKIFFGDGAGKNDTVVAGEGSLCAAPEEGEVEYPEQAGVYHMNGAGELLVVELYVSAEAVYPAGRFYPGYVLFQCGAHGDGGDGVDEILSFCLFVDPCPGDAGGSGVESVVAEFAAYEEHDQDAAGDAGGETEYIDEGIALVSQQVAKGDFEIIFYHMQCFVM